MFDRRGFLGRLLLGVPVVGALLVKAEVEGEGERWKCNAGGVGDWIRWIHAWNEESGEVMSWHRFLKDDISGEKAVSPVFKIDPEKLKSNELAVEYEVLEVPGVKMSEFVFPEEVMNVWRSAYCEKNWSLFSGEGRDKFYWCERKKGGGE